MSPSTLSRDEARAHLLAHLGLRGPRRTGAAGVRDLLTTLRHVQVDPLDPMGTNADLVVLARVDGVRRGDLHRHLFPGHAFEHFAKERCLLPAAAFPYYRDQTTVTPWWRLHERHRRLSSKLVDRVLAEVRERGPVSVRELTDHGGVEPIDWSGWKGTGRATTMAIEILWTQCRVVVAGRGPGGKLFDVPERALPAVNGAPSGAFDRWALLERVTAAGLLSRAGGATWSTLDRIRKTPLVDELVREGAIEEVRVEGSPRSYVVPRGLRERSTRRDDRRMRILGPLDPLLWDRTLVRTVFGFDYAWEVYKPKSRRRFGWYVCPLLHRGHLVGRVEGRVEGETLVVDRVWREPDHELDEDALDACLERHAAACRCDSVKRPKVRVA